jgi:hypothetical protein
MLHLRRSAQRVRYTRVCGIQTDESTKVSQNLTRASKVRGTGWRGLATAAEPYDVVVIGGGAFCHWQSFRAADSHTL